MSHKKLITFLLLLLFLPGLKPKQAAAQLTHTVFQSKTLDVYVDKTLYQVKNNESIYIHITLINKSSSKIGVDFSDKFRVLYANQWKVCKTPFDTVKESYRITPEDMDEKKCIYLKEKFNKSELISIDPGHSLDYYSEIIGCKSSSLILREGEYFVFTIDGQLFYTDGFSFGQVNCKDDNSIRRKIALPYPLQLKTISEEKLKSYINTGLKQNELAEPPNTHLFYQSTMLNVYVDKLLYRSDSSEYFYLKFTLLNRSDSIVGVDFTEKQKILYPNHWSISNTPFEKVTDESQIIPDKLSENKCLDLKNKFSSKRLAMIVPRKSMSYYTEFNGYKASKIELTEGNYMIISIDGQLFYTNGSIYGHISCDDDLNIRRYLVIAFPLVWKDITNSNAIKSRN